MLYTKLYVVGLSLYGLNKISTAKNYTAYANSNAWQDWSCDINAGSSDRCIFHCDIGRWGYKINCGSSGTCDIHVEEKSCLKNSIITATDTSELIIHPGTAIEPYDGAVFELPSFGNAYFSPAITTNSPYTFITINSGSNTQEIHVDCTMNNCDQIQINAKTSQFLYIESKDSSWNGGTGGKGGNAMVDCPENSAYNGPYTSPCYINVNNGELWNILINTLYGYPHDAYIAISNPNDLNNVVLTCSAMSKEVKDSDILQNGANNECYNTHEPTLAPTTIPTELPTETPTDGPTVTPTPQPTSKPTVYPTEVPTTDPINAPTKKTAMPSVNPTLGPTQYPTLESQEPTETPTLIPTTFPTFEPADQRTTDTEGVDEDESVSIVDHSLNATLQAILVGLVVLVICTAIVVVGFCVYYRKQEKQKHIKRGLSLSVHAAGKRSQIKVDRTAHAEVNIVAYKKKERIGTNDFYNEYVAPLDDTMKEVDSNFSEGDAEEVVIRISKKENEMTKKSRATQSSARIMNTGYDNEPYADHDSAELAVEDNDEEKAVEDILDNHVTKGNDSVDAMDEMIDSDSDNDVIFQPTRGGD